MTGLITHTVRIPLRQEGGAALNLHAETAGPEDGPLVILLHGFPEFWYGWRGQIGPLARSGLRVVAPDQRGYNLSDKPPGVDAYDVDALAADVAGIMDYFGRERAAVVGHDWGGVVAWQVAINYPERVEKLAILNAPHPAAYTELLWSPGSGQLARSWYVYAFQIPGWAEFTIRLTSYRSLAWALRSSGRPGTFTGEDVRRYRDAWRQPGALTGMINWYRAAVRRFLRLGKDEYLRAVERRIRPPALILWGERDVALRPELAPKSLAWCDQGQLVRFPEATHWLQHDEPSRVSSRLVNFLVADED